LPEKEPTEGSSSRELDIKPHASYYPEHVNRWAVIVGISKHQHESWDLKYAHRDAEELYKLIQTPSGGGFEGEHIVYLTDERATAASITRALRSFLKKPAKEDIVLLYFACHGAPDPQRPANLYLIMHDTDPNDIAGTALPMREIDLSLKENLYAERVVVIADTCHSAALGGRVGRSVNDAEAVNRYLQDLSKTKSGIALLTSAEANETAQEDEQWGGGHGVFTHYLLEGMRGAAADHKGNVAVGKLFEYVRESVKEATNDQQHPCIGTNPFDRNLPLANTSGITGEKHLQLGCHLHHIGQLLDDRGRFASAGRQFEEALQLLPRSSPLYFEAKLQLGRSLMALEQYQEAADVLQEAVKQGCTDGFFLLGITYAKQGLTKEASNTLSNFVDRHPEDENAAWVKEYVESLQKAQRGKKYALLIGIDEYLIDRVWQRGSVNDAEKMYEVLTQHFAFPAKNITLLRNAEATREGILAALQGLQHQTNPDDVVFVHYSGMAYEDELIVHDTVIDNRTNKVQNAIDTSILHDLMEQASACKKTVFLDAMPVGKWMSLARQEASYQLFMAASLNEVPAERPFKEAEEERTYGLFTYVLAQQLAIIDAETATYGQLLERVRSEVAKISRHQTPILIGSQNRTIFTSRDDYLEAFDFSQRKNYMALTEETISRKYAELRRHVKASFPQLHRGFGRAFLEKKSYAEAIEALQRANGQREGKDHEITFALGKAHFNLENYNEAIPSLKAYCHLPQSSGPQKKFQTLLKLLEQMESRQKHALLVGINEYGSPDIPPLRGAVNDVHALQQVLFEQYGFRRENTKVLLNEEATYSNIMNEFRKLVEQGSTAPALFYFSGHGSVTKEDAPTIISTDGRQGSIYDIELQELATVVTDKPTNLVTIMDAGWTRADESSDKRRRVRRDLRERPGTRDLVIEIGARELEGLSLKIGISIYNKSIEDNYRSGLEDAPDLEGGSPEPHGAMTHGLIQYLKDANPTHVTYGDLPENLVRVFGDDLSERLFRNRVLQALLNDIEHEPIHESIRLIRRIIEQKRNIYPEGHLNLGIALALTGQFKESRTALNEAIDQQENYAEAYYHLGRVLYEIKENLGRAVDLLRDASNLEPDNSRIHYYLGQALRALVERNLLEEARRALQTYLNDGALLGQLEEVQDFLASRSSQR